MFLKCRRIYAHKVVRPVKGLFEWSRDQFLMLSYLSYVWLIWIWENTFFFSQNINRVCLSGIKAYEKVYSRFGLDEINSKRKMSVDASFMLATQIFHREIEIEIDVWMAMWKTKVEVGQISSHYALVLL